jgi:N-acylneuraminate cytidylyltransferase
MKIFTIIKENSVRVPRKNFLDLGGIPLWKHSINELSDKEIFIDTDSQTILDECKELDWVTAYKREKDFILMENDPDNKISPVLKMIQNFLEKYVDDENEIIVTTHVTSPFLKRSTIDNACSYIGDEFDSVVSCTKHKEFCYFQGSPINFDPRVVQRTQDLEPVFMLNGAFFIFTKRTFIENSNRIGKRPFFYELSYKESIEIDYPEDFELVKKLFTSYENN